MTMNKQFLIDLKRGKIEEKKVFNYYKKYYSNAQHIEGYEKKYDIIIPEKFSIEVKLDERSKISGNYFIEAFYENSPSGINVTTAKLWVISNGEKYLFVNTKEIKNAVKNLQLKTVVLHGKEVKFYLVKKDILNEKGGFINLD